MTTRDSIVNFVGTMYDKMHQRKVAQDIERARADYLMSLEGVQLPYVPEKVQKSPTRHYAFAEMTPERLREVSAKGGRNSQASGKGHRFTSEEAKVVGRIGGHISAIKRRLNNGK